MDFCIYGISLHLEMFIEAISDGQDLDPNRDPILASASATLQMYSTGSKPVDSWMES
jgi:hypothetical protein